MVVGMLGKAGEEQGHAESAWLCCLRSGGDDACNEMLGPGSAQENHPKLRGLPEASG